MVGIVGYGSYVPRLRMSRSAIYEANKWFAPGLKGKSKGHVALANWDEDPNTMAVEACRAVIDSEKDRAEISDLFLASTTHVFAERQNSGIIKEALRLGEETGVMDIGGGTSAAANAISTAIAASNASAQNALLVASDYRRSRAASPSELTYGDGAASLMFGKQGVIAELLAHKKLTVDFIDQFRQSGNDVNYNWEERWVRDEGASNFVPKTVKAALDEAGIQAGDVDHFVFPSRFKRFDAKIAKAIGVDTDKLVPSLHENIGHFGVANVLVHIIAALEKATPGQLILVAEFGGGASAMVLKTTSEITSYKPRATIADWLQQGREETNYTKYLSFKGQLNLEKGMRGEQDRKAALSTLYRHKKAILGFVAGRCKETGSVSFPPSRLSYDPQGSLLDSQQDYPLSEKIGTVLSCSAEALSYYPAPPHQYGQVDFEGGGRVAMEFTDVDPGDVQAGTSVEMVFRVKDRDELRGFTRYFWKAVPRS